MALFQAGSLCPPAHSKEFLAPRLANLLWRKCFELGQSPGDDLSCRLHHLGTVPMCPPDRLWDDSVDYAQFEQILGRESRHRIEAAASGEATV